MIVTDYVLAETLNLARERLGPETSNALLDRLVEGAHFEIDHATRSDFDAAQAPYRRHGGLSFVDATIATYTERAEIDHLYSIDDDFDALDGVTRLDAAVNPFE